MTNSDSAMTVAATRVTTDGWAMTLDVTRVTTDDDSQSMASRLSNVDFSPTFRDLASAVDSATGDRSLIADVVTPSTDD